MPRLRLLALTGALLASLALSAAAAPPAQVVPLPAEVVPVRLPAQEHTYATTDADGNAVASRWRVVKNSGNCCENYLTTTPQGRVLDFGGTFINFSDDDGRTWQRVRPTTPLISGEGTVALAPNGDIVGVGWDPYSGDHLQSFKYDAATDRWLWAEQPLHTPFYDREWVAVVPGPITVGGQERPYAVILRGGFPSKDVYFISGDGLTYLTASSKQLDTALTAAATAPLAPVVSAHSDYGQANVVSRLAPLGERAVLTGADLLTGLPPANACRSQTWLAGADLRWACYTPAEGEAVQWQAVDSTGRLHATTWSPGGTVSYLTSTDGGRTVARPALPLPDGYEVVSPNHRDLKANAAAGVVAITVHARKTADNSSQDFVFVYRYEGDDIVLDRIHRVGLGDLRSDVGVGASGARFDFSTVAILPDGRIAVSFNDSKHTSPAVAIELPSTAARASSGAGAAEETVVVPNAPAR
jgi:hypothetical protein